MSLTVIYRGKYIKFGSVLKKSLWLPAAFLMATLVAWAAYQTISLSNERDAIELQLRLAQQEYRAQKEDLAQLKQKAQTQLSAVQLKIGELQGEVNRLNAFGQKLAVVADIPDSEFNFSQTSAIGGGTGETVPELAGQGASSLMLQIDDMLLQLDGQQQKMALLESLLLNHNIEKGSYLSGRPVNDGWLSSYYGVRKDPFTGLPADHMGIDFAGKMNDDVIATGSGIISWAGDRFGYGQMIEVDHGDGFKTRYGHNNKLLVEVGDVVEKGQVIAKMGSSGRSTGPHVHYEILKGERQINPLKYVYRSIK